MKNVEKYPNHIFILSSGRSGSKTIAEFLNSIPDCSVAHEAEPKLLQETIEYLTGKMSQKEMVELLYHTRSAKSLGGKLLSGESNQRLSFVIPALAEAFPQARYLWLIRDGRQNVASLYNRYWYHSNEIKMRSPKLAKWASTRLQGDQVGDIPDEEWSGLDAFGRCCWYWSYTNRVIRRESVRYNLKIRICRIECLGEELLEILHFLGIGTSNRMRVHRSNIFTSRRPLAWKYWSRNQRKMFSDIAGGVMDEHYPEWRDEIKLSLGQELKGFPLRFYRAFLTTTWPTRAKLRLTRANR